jgi:hypothetical protein
VAGLLTTTVLALFKDQADAEAAVRALRSARFDSAQLGNLHAEHAQVPKYGENAVVGILGGAIGCGLTGALLGVAMTALDPQAFPGGWFVPFMIGLAGAATGAVAGMLLSMSMSRQHAMYYEDAVAAGRTLVSVHAEPDRIEQARRILLDEGAFEAAPIDSPLRKAS